MASSVNLTGQGGVTWSSHGPEGGYIVKLAINPMTPTTLYAAAWGGGIFKSTNAGGSWTNVLNSSVDLSYVWTLAIDRVTPTAVYAGTWGEGVLKSIDAGATWNDANNGVTDINIDSTPTALWCLC